MLSFRLVAGPDLWSRMPLKCSITMVFACPLLSWCKIWSPFRENKNIIGFPVPFPYLHAVGQLVVHPPSRIVSHPRTRSFRDLYLLIHPPRRPFAIFRGRILPPGFIRSPPTLAVNDVSHFLPLGGTSRGVSFTEDTSLELRKWISLAVDLWLFPQVLSVFCCDRDERLLYGNARLQ